jgi:hypothetical protein
MDIAVLSGRENAPDKKKSIEWMIRGNGLKRFVDLKDRDARRDQNRLKNNRMGEFVSAFSGGMRYF